MNPPFVIVRGTPYDQPHSLGLEVRASNGTFSGATGLHVAAEELRDVGVALTRFPARAGDEVVYEYGSDDPADRTYTHLRMRAYTVDTAGHCALQFVMSRDADEPEEGACRFSIPAEAAQPAGRSAGALRGAGAPGAAVGPRVRKRPALRGAPVVSGVGTLSGDGGMITETLHLTRAELEAGLDEIRAAPADDGVLRMIVRRPAVDAREVLETAELDRVVGLVGDTWSGRSSSRTPDGSPHPDMQLTLMSARVIALVAGRPERWPLAGDQLFADLDLSEANLPPGTRLVIGTAVVEVTEQPHTGCRKFVDRFGSDAMKFVNSPEGRALRLRGVNTRVVQSGTVRVGDLLRKLPDEAPR